jgi:hypothetical protein
MEMLDYAITLRCNENKLLPSFLKQ